MRKLDAIIFDIDGTLVDVSKSYREAIRLTAGDFLGRTVNRLEFDAVKSQPGFNNDWDATYALVSARPNPPAYQKVKDRFQEYYLGGLINAEKLIVSKSVLRTLKSTYKLGIVTGRPRSEATLVLKRLGISTFFEPSAIICLEDSPLGKPSPDPLLLCQTRLESSFSMYIGDSINDQIAAKRAGMPFAPAPLILNKLTPAIIQDRTSRQILMLGYINLEAFITTVSTGYVYFWSRSRKELWLKGQTSGNKLNLKKILIDCDQDTLLIEVDYSGKAVCHLGTPSCFTDLNAKI